MVVFGIGDIKLPSWIHKDDSMNDCHTPDLIDHVLRSQRPRMRIPAFDLLGVHLDAMTKQDLVNTVVQAVDARTQCIIGNHNLHSLYLWGNEPKIRKFYSLADYIQIDGMPLVWLGRFFGLPFKPKHRTTNLDLLPLLANEAVSRQWRMFYLGSRPGVAEKAARKLRIQYPGFQIATHDGYFNTAQSEKENQSVLAQIRDYAPDVLMVGMGMPRQEIWIEENLKDIVATTIFCCGGLMDLVAGEIPTPPRWLGSVGLEWLFRLFSQPVRTWRRYLLEPWLIVFRIIKHYLRYGHLSIAGDTTTCDETEQGVRDRKSVV